MSKKQRARMRQNVSLVRRPIAAQLDTVVSQHKEQVMSENQTPNAENQQVATPDLNEPPKPFAAPVVEIASMVTTPKSDPVGNVSGARNPDVERSPQAGSQRRRETGIDFTQHNAGLAPQTAEQQAEGESAGEGSLDAWLTTDRFRSLLTATIEFAVPDRQMISELITSSAMRLDVEPSKILFKLSVSKEDSNDYVVNVALTGTLDQPFLTFLIKTQKQDDRPVMTGLSIIKQPGERWGGRHIYRTISLPRSWMSVQELAHHWPKIFNEDDLGSALIQRLGDLEKRTDGSLRARFVVNDETAGIVLQVFKVADLPSFTNVRAPFITKQDKVVDPVDVITIFTSIVEGVEQAVKLEVADHFVAPQHAPKESAEDTAKQFAPRGTPPAALVPADIRTFDPVAFQYFVDGIMRSAMAQNDRDRLVAFMEFIAKCQQIEQTLFFHCTALGRQLDLLLSAGRRHFPGDTQQQSMFAPGARWSSYGVGPRNDQQAPNTAGLVQPNQLASDVVISVYNSTGVLLGVFQAAAGGTGFGSTKV